jgi:hypothetical protein
MIELTFHYPLYDGRCRPGHDEPDWLRAEQDEQDWHRAKQDEQEHLRTKQEMHS